jgi:YHS domain-containing protein
MFRLILLAGIVYLLLKWLRRSAPKKEKEPTFQRRDPAVEEMMRDPVCGTYVPASQAVTLQREKETLYFCSAGCRDKFEEIPKTR